MAHRRPRQTSEQWKVIIADFHRSGLAAATYCQEQDLAPATFQKWRHRFAGKPTVPVTQSKPTGFTQVYPTASPEQATGVSVVTLEVGPQITLSIHCEP